MPEGEPLARLRVAPQPLHAEDVHVVHGGAAVRIGRGGGAVRGVGARAEGGGLQGGALGRADHLVLDAAQGLGGALLEILFLALLGVRRRFFRFFDLHCILG